MNRAMFSFAERAYSVQSKDHKCIEEQLICRKVIFYPRFLYPIDWIDPPVSENTYH